MGTSLDFFHTFPQFPITRHSTASITGKIISIIFIFIMIIYFIREVIRYHKNYTVTYAQNFVNNIEDHEQKITLGFKLDEEYLDEIRVDILNSLNKNIKEKYLKNCDENLNEIEEINSDNNITKYICLIDYPLFGSNISNHIIKIRLEYTNNFNISNHNRSKRIPLYIKFKEPYINHDDKNDPFKYPDEIYEYVYFYSLNLTISYSKYIKIIEYKTKEFIYFWDYDKKSAFLEDYEDSSKSHIIDNVTGTFRFALSKKKDIFVREYLSFTNFFGCIFGIMSSFMKFFGFLEYLFVERNDNLRIYNSLLEKKPYLKEAFNKIKNDYIEKKKT